MLVYTLLKEAVKKHNGFVFKTNEELSLDCFEQGNKSLEGKHYLTAIQYYDMWQLNTTPASFRRIFPEVNVNIIWNHIKAQLMI
jgi:hypothetical protein